jgi:hypothetical protein
MSNTVSPPINSIAYNTRNQLRIRNTRNQDITCKRLQRSSKRKYSSISVLDPINSVAYNTRNRVKMRDNLQDARLFIKNHIQPYKDFYSYIQDVNKLLISFASKYNYKTNQYIKMPENGFNRAQRRHYRNMYTIIQDFNDKIEMWYKNNIGIEYIDRIYNLKRVDYIVYCTIQNMNRLRHNITCILFNA